MKIQPRERNLFSSVWGVLESFITGKRVGDAINNSKTTFKKSLTYKIFQITFQVSFQRNKRRAKHSNQLKSINNPSRIYFSTRLLAAFKLFVYRIRQYTSATTNTRTANRSRNVSERARGGTKNNSA